MASVYNAHGAARTGASGGEAGMNIPIVRAAVSRSNARVLRGPSAPLMSAVKSGGSKAL